MRHSSKRDPETRALLESVFDRVWDQVRTLPSVAVEPRNEREARDELAKRISEAHANGEHDPQALELIALRAFDRWAKPISQAKSD
jgi:hypothetical protein